MSLVEFNNFTHSGLQVTLFVIQKTAVIVIQAHHACQFRTVGGTGQTFQGVVWLRLAELIPLHGAFVLFQHINNIQIRRGKLGVCPNAAIQRDHQRRAKA